MKNSKWFALVALTGVLASCNPLALIPPQKFENNPINLDNKQIISEVLAPQAVGANLSFETDAFADFDKSAMPIQGAAPDLTELTIKVKKVRISGCETAPATFKVSLKQVAVEFRNVGSQQGPKVSQKPDPVEGTASNKTSVENVFEYDLDSTKEILFSFGRDVFDTVTSGGNNIAIISGQVTADQDALAGCRISAVVDDHILVFKNFR